MATFTRLECWSDLSCASGVRVAAFEPSDLVSAVLKTSLTGVESLTFTTSRQITKVSELVHGRVIRVCYSDTSLDTEWRIAELVDQSGTGDSSQLSVVCQSILLDLARAPFVDWDSAGRATFAFSAPQLTSSEWIDTYVLPACVEAGMTWVARGTQDYTTEFDLDGEYVTALEILRAMQQAGRAPGELALRRNGSTNYLIDLLVARGASATTVRVQTRKNLLAHQRTRRYQDIGTKIIPRANSDATVRDMSHALWRVQTVVDGTHADLEDPNGGADPIAYDDQLNGMYCAPIASTFASQQITDSTASNSRIEVASTAGFTAGTTLLRFFRTSGSAGEALISLSHPTRSVSPASGGFGVVTRILDVEGGSGDENLVGNPWMSTWTTGTNPPDGYTLFEWNVLAFTTSRESAIIRLGSYSYKFISGISSASGYYNPGMALTNVASGVSGVYTPTLRPWTTAGRRYSAHAWVYLTARTNGGVQLVAADASTLVPFASGPAAITTDQWVKLELTGLDCSARTNGIVLAVRTVPDWIEGQPYWGTPWYTNLTFYVDAFGFNEADASPTTDVVFSGGNALWQRANVALAAISDIVTGYTVALADLARLDDTAWSDEPLTLGGNLEIVDSDLSVTTTQRVVDLEQDLLNPLRAAVQLATPETLLTKTLAGGTLATGSISGSSGIVTAAGTASGFGITNVYTKTEVDALVANAIATLAPGDEDTLRFLGVRLAGVGNNVNVSTGGAAVSLFEFATAAATVVEVFGTYNDTDSFWDIVVVDGLGTPSVNAVLTADTKGTPRNRTYSLGTNDVKLALDGAAGITYNAVIFIRELTPV